MPTMTLYCQVFHRESTQSCLQVSTRKRLKNLPSKQNEDLDFNQWMQMDRKRFYVQITYKRNVDTNVDPRKAIASFIKKICTEKISTISIEAFVTCWLILLEKNPGLWPIGTGKVLLRITYVILFLSIDTMMFYMKNYCVTT